MSRLDTSTGQRHPADHQPRRTSSHLNVFNPGARLTISNPDVSIPSNEVQHVPTFSSDVARNSVLGEGS